MDKPEWKTYLERCNEILGGDSPDDFGHEFIEDVGVWIEEREHVTEAQKDGIDNIYQVYEERNWL